MGHVGGRGAGRLAVVAAVPGLKHVEAVGAGARRVGARVEVCVLVERHHEARVPVAEDVAAPAAVVAAGEVVEVALAGGVVAHGGLGVRLCQDKLVRISDAALVIEEVWELVTQLSLIHI